MKTFVQPLEGLSGFSDLVKAATKDRGLYSITGCIDPQKPHMIYSFNNGLKHKVIVTFSEQKAREIYEDMKFFDKSTYYYPSKDFIFYSVGFLLVF